MSLADDVKRRGDRMLKDIAWKLRQTHGVEAMPDEIAELLFSLYPNPADALHEIAALAFGHPDEMRFHVLARALEVKGVE